jgi:hypothetical protein
LDTVGFQRKDPEVPGAELDVVIVPPLAVILLATVRFPPSLKYIVWAGVLSTPPGLFIETN